LSKLKVRALVEGVDEFIGIDAHKKNSYITIRNPQGETIRQGGVVTSRASISDYIRSASPQENSKIPRRMAVMECGRAYRPMYRWLKEEVDEILLAHPGSLKIISETVYRDDKIDSEKLVDLLMLGVVPQAHAASDEAWERRMILRHRVMLVRTQTSVKNRIHVIADLYPDASPTRPDVSDIFGKLGLDWLRRLELPPSERWRLKELLDLLGYLKQKIAASDAMVRDIVRKDERCQLLKTLPGVGDFFSALIMAEVDTIERFPSAGGGLRLLHGACPRLGYLRGERQRRAAPQEGESVFALGFCGGRRTGHEVESRSQEPLRPHMR
jgi:transposase